MKIFLLTLLFISLRAESLKTMITFTDGGSRDHIRRDDIKTLQEQFDFMLAVGVGPSARDDELRMLSTKGLSIHVKEYNGELHQFFSLILN